MEPQDTSGRWFDNAVIYSVDVRAFQDSDGDGVGDLDGLRRRLHHVASLGATALWLSPILPTPYRDGGYDVTDYYGVDDAVGGLPAFARLRREADQLGLRLILDLPLNHTSVDHPWFQVARTNRESRYRSYYVWADEPPDGASDEQIVFRDGGSGPWTFDEEAGQHYFHRFYEDEPDLNHANPEVREEVARVMEFWLEMGAAGIRLDAAPYLAEKAASEAPDRPAGGHRFLAELNRRARATRHDALLMAEADVAPDALRDFFGDGGEMQMLFNFVVNNYFFVALARRDADALRKALQMLPNRVVGAQWANWVRNHDELDLERLTRSERAEVMDAFAPEDEMRIYGRGIRRRFAPMVEGDQARLELAYSMLLALPGVPVIRYGEEIGMGDDLALPEREAVRTPMQWSPAPNAGFSTAPPAELAMPVIDTGPFSYLDVNVAAQMTDRGSLLSRIRTLVAARRQAPAIGLVEPQVLEADDPAVFAILYATQPCGDGADGLLILHNLSAEDVEVKVSGLASELCYDIAADRAYPGSGGGDGAVALSPYGYRWCRAVLGSVPS